MSVSGISSGSPTTSSWTSCYWCGLIHVGGGICPRVREIEYYPNGTVKRVEFHPQMPIVPPMTIFSTPPQPLTIRLAKDTKPEDPADA